MFELLDRMRYTPRELRSWTDHVYRFSPIPLERREAERLIECPVAPVSPVGPTEAFYDGRHPVVEKMVP